MAHKVLHNMQNQISVLQLSLAEREATLAEKEQRLCLLEEELVRLRQAGKTVARQQPESVRALPVLAADPKTGKALCAAHGSVSPNVRRQCPACFIEAVRAAAGVKAPVAA